MNEEKNDTNILTKISFNNIECYYEEKEGGIVYSKNAEVIGEYKDNKISLF